VVKRAEEAIQQGEESPRLLGAPRAQITTLLGHLLDMADEALNLMDRFS
jgi:hypothetical protein